MDSIIIAIGVFILFIFLGYNNLIRKRLAVYKYFESINNLIGERNNLIKEIISSLNNNTHLNKLSNLIEDESKGGFPLSNQIVLNNKINNVIHTKELKEILERKETFIAIQSDLNNKIIEINKVIKTYNNSVYLFPSNVFAMLFGFKKIPELEVFNFEKT